MSDRPEEEEPESFDYEVLAQAVRRNDKLALVRILKAAQRRNLLLPAGVEDETVLHLAASGPQYRECLALILRHGQGVLDLDAQTDEGESALDVACEKGLDRSVLLLLQAGCNPNLPIDEKPLEESPLHLAAENGFPKVVGHLLDFGANMDERNYEGYFPLHLAAEGRNPEICRMLLERGANAEVTNRFGETPLHSIFSGEIDDTGFVWNYMDFGLLNRRDDYGVTPFMRAAAYLDAERVQYLLDKGGRTDLYDDAGMAAVHHAATTGRPETLQLLLRRTDLSDYKGFALRSLASLSHSRRNFESLINCPFVRYRTLNPGVRLNPLLTSELPRSVLQMPSAAYENDNAADLRVYSPLARLIEKRGDFEDEFDELLRSLIERKILLLDEFKLEFQFDWPQNAVFRHPFDDLVGTSVEAENRVTADGTHVFCLLRANGVTTDYCLQSYHDTAEPFASFTAYYRYYKLVIRAVRENDADAVKLLLSNSVVLEPDKLLIYSTWHDSTGNRVDREPRGAEQGSYDMYRYLTSLKPIYYMRQRVQRDCHSNFWPYLEHDAEEFSRVTLSQLCRTALREYLREPSLEGNLRNFRKKIMDLLLPNTLKDYLLFKS